ncbi:MAG TPA: hypothetical protein VEH31_05125, partial [Streptosporangiaceae bacterium]|nr:hypothetical protein [Streptosporangiaceae bacterium]
MGRGWRPERGRWWAAAAGAVAGWRTAHGPLLPRAGGLAGSPGGTGLRPGWRFGVVVSRRLAGQAGLAGVEAAVTECPAAQAV